MKRMAFFFFILFGLALILPVSAAFGVLATPTPTPVPSLIISRPVYIPTTTPVPVGAITISSVPAGAEVTIDGTIMGTTTFTIRTLTAGSHSLLLTMEGYQDYPGSFTITTGQLVQKTYTLTPLPAATPATSPATPFAPVAPVLPAATSLPVTLLTTVTVQPPSSSPMPSPTPLPVLPVPAARQAPQQDVCHYDPAAARCAGTCPETGKTCEPVNQSTCSDSPGMAPVTCGCVDTRSRVSLATAGLLNVSVAPQPRHGTLPARSLLDSAVAFITGIMAPKQSLTGADPRAYTRDSVQAMTVRATGACPPDLFRTTLVFADGNSAFINTESGNQQGTFTWDSIDPRVRTAIWQVSIFPYPASGNNWSAVPGLLAQGNLDGDQHTFTIDFSKSVPTAGDAALAWEGKPAFLRVEKTMMTTLKTGLLAQETAPAGQGDATRALTRQTQASDIDSAVAALDQKIARPASFTLAAPAKSAGYLSPVSMAAGVVSVKGQTAGLPRTYTAKAGVLAPVLAVPPITKGAIAGTLPQNQRTLFVRVVPFDGNGNYTGNPSNTEEVVIGEPRYTTTGPWSGWGPLSGPDPSGSANPPEIVSFGDRLYLFSVRSDNLVYMSSIDQSGASTGWTQVPGSPPAARVAAVAYGRAGRTGSFPYLYLFTTRQDTGLTWYTRMDTSGAWSAWAQVPQKDTSRTYELKKALLIGDEIYLLARYDYQKYHPDDETYTHPPASYVYQQMFNSGTWTKDWLDTGVGTDSPDKVTGSDDVYDNEHIFDVSYWNSADGNPHFDVYSLPYQQSCASCTPATMKRADRIDVPSGILGSATSPDDFSATFYHDRIYFVVRGKGGHIYVAWKTIMSPVVGSGPQFGTLSEWEDISPDQTASDSSIVALTSPEGDRLDILANNIQPAPVEHTGMWGTVVNTFSVLFPPKPTGLNRDTLGGAPENTQLLVSASGDRQSPVGNGNSGYFFDYILTDSNVSWTRTTPLWFAWNSSEPVLYDAEWQVSTTPFDEIHPKFDDKGIVARGWLDTSTTDSDFVPNPLGTGGLPTYTDKVHLFPVDFSTFATPADPANPSVTHYYIRVVAAAPTGTPGSFTVSPSEQMVVDWAPQAAFTFFNCTPPMFYGYSYGVPKISIVGYTPIQPMAPDASCHVIVTTGHSWWANWYLQNGNKAMLMPYTSTGDPNKDADLFATKTVGPAEYGWTENLCAQSSHSDSWWDDFVGAIEDLVSFAASLVDNFADTYATVKAVIIASACGGNGPCETVMSTGVDAGLAALGVPPSIPNFDALMNDGADYLAGSIADEYGVPVDDVGDIVDAAQSIRNIAAGSQSVPDAGFPYGLQPDPAYQYQPARLMVQLENDDPVNVTPPGQFRFSDFSGLFKTTQPDTPFPSLAPGKTITFPLILEENQWQDTSCTECMGNECDSVPCDDWSAEGQINPGWWDQYQQAANAGDEFALHYDGLSANFTKNITWQMENKYNVIFNIQGGTYNQFGLTQTNCMADKYGLDMDPASSDGNLLTDPLSELNLNSLVQPWGSQ